MPTLNCWQSSQDLARVRWSLDVPQAVRRSSEEPVAATAGTDNRISPSCSSPLTTYPNGVAQSASYDVASGLTSIQGAKGTAVLTRFP